MDTPVRIGLIGAGQIGTQHLINYGNIPEARVVAVADLFPERVEAARHNFDVASGYADFQDLLARDDIDAVDVCVHNNKHAPVTMAALKAGKHVYCEKPMAGSFRDAEEMLQTARACDRWLHIQLANIYTVETRSAKRLIDDGHLGKIYHARSYGFRRRGRPFVDGYGSPSFVNREIAAGGALFDMGIYHLTQVLHLIGNPAVRTVTGAAHQELEMYEDRREFSGYSVEEMALGWVRLENGISFDIEETWAAHHDGQESSKILGSRGGLRLDPLAYFSTLSDLSMNATFDVKSADTRWHACVQDTAWYDSSQRHWIGALLGRVPLLPTAEYARNAALISEGIYLSSKAGRELASDEIREQSQSTAIDPYTPERVWKT
jgi:predicted dehydrogenase